MSYPPLTSTRSDFRARSWISSTSPHAAEDRRRSARVEINDLYEITPFVVTQIQQLFLMCSHIFIIYLFISFYFFYFHNRKKKRYHKQIKLKSKSKLTCLTEFLLWIKRCFCYFVILCFDKELIIVFLYSVCFRQTLDVHYKKQITKNSKKHFECSK